jgi:hypothetical protein
VRDWRTRRGLPAAAGGSGRRPGGGVANESTATTRFP